MKRKMLAKTDIIIVENNSADLRYLTSLVKTLRLRMNEGPRLAANPKPISSESEARRRLPASDWSLVKGAGCVVLDMDLGEGAKEAGINWMGEIAQNAETPIIVVTGHRERFKSSLESVDGLTPLLVIEKPSRGLPENFSPTSDESLIRFNDILSQAIISACYISGRLGALYKNSSEKPHKRHDLREMLPWMLQKYPVRTLLALALVATILAAWAIIALTHWHVL
jgi:hypothetical protein